MDYVWVPFVSLADSNSKQSLSVPKGAAHTLKRNSIMNIVILHDFPQPNQDGETSKRFHSLGSQVTYDDLSLSVLIYTT